MLARQDQPEAESGSRTLRELLDAAALELRHAYERGLRLEEAILALMSRNTSGESFDLSELQHLDMVLQHVSAVSAFLSALARSQSAASPVGGLEAALACVTLNDVRQRLLGLDVAAAEDDDWQLLQG